MSLDLLFRVFWLLFSPSLALREARPASVFHSILFEKESGIVCKHSQ